MSSKIPMGNYTKLLESFFATVAHARVSLEFPDRITMRFKFEMVMEAHFALDARVSTQIVAVPSMLAEMFLELYSGNVLTIA